MLVIIPLGGLGTRFSNEGYSLPKPLINVMGKPIIEWLLDSLSLNTKDNVKVLIPYNNSLFSYNFEATIKKKYPELDILFLCLKENTGGAAETLLKILENYEMKNDEDDCVISLDGDNFYSVDILKLWNCKNMVFCFEDNVSDGIFSYLELKDNIIVDIKEKNKISKWASTGAYCFESWKVLKEYCQMIIHKKIKQKGEYYISNVIREMIKDKHEFNSIRVDLDNYICLGTPLHVRIFCNSYYHLFAKKLQLVKKRYCFDLDNTLVTYPKVHGDYTSVDPIEKNIKVVRRLYNSGNTIIIQTARRMRTHNGNIGKLLKDIGKITFDTLEKFNIPYHEIYFGKPYADYYIDDLAVSAFSDLEKELGFYDDNIDTRDFNSLSKSTLHIYRKKAKDGNLKGEIMYYKNLDVKVKSLFPIFVNYDSKDFKWYEMERLNGIPISKLYLTESLKIKQLDAIIDNLKKLHSIKTKDDIDIYVNYCTKLKTRYNNYDYSKFKDSKDVFEKLLILLNKYEKDDSGVKSMIHGDPVMTNIIIDQYGTIKFIDMRGKLSNKYTCFGDEMYDWAKLYQSLIGYDEILNECNVSSKYKNYMINHFKKRFNEIYSKDEWERLQYLTASLLFTLIPLHDNKKCMDYYALIFELI